MVIINRDCQLSESEDYRSHVGYFGSQFGSGNRQASDDQSGQ